MTREELLRKLETRIERTLGRLGIEATVVSLGRSGWVSNEVGAWGSGPTVGYARDAAGGEELVGASPGLEARGGGLSGGAFPLSLQVGEGSVSEDVLDVVRETVREFIAEHAVDFVRHFSGRPDPKTLN